MKKLFNAIRDVVIFIFGGLFSLILMILTVLFVRKRKKKKEKNKK